MSETLSEQIDYYICKTTLGFLVSITLFIIFAPTLLVERFDPLILESRLMFLAAAWLLGIFSYGMYFVGDLFWSMISYMVKHFGMVLKINYKEENKVE